VRPCTRISPAAIASKPAMQRSRVVLPQPEGPSRQAMLAALDTQADAIDDGV
jgi:hypothetical protein